MGNTIQKIRPGQRLDGIPAGSWNAFVDAAVDHRRRHLVVDRIREINQAGLVPVLNDSGYACDRFSVLSLGTPFPAPSDDEEGFSAGPVIYGDTPATTDWGRFAILLEPASDGEIVPAVVSGITVAQLYAADTYLASCPYADVKNGDRGQLACDPMGSAEVLWRESGTGTKLGVVRLGPTVPRFYWGTLDGDLVQATGYATVSLEISGIDTNWNVTAYAPPVMAAGSTIASGSDVGVRFVPEEQKTYVVHGPCA